MRFKTHAKKKKSQAAMEYLMTHGWAALAILAGISALFYFQPFSGDHMVVEKCFFSAGFGCQDFKYEADTFTFVISNGMQKKLNDVYLELDLDKCSGTSQTIGEFEFETQKKFKVNCPTTATKVKGELILHYRNPETNLTKTKTGEMIAKTNK